MSTMPATTPVVIGDCAGWLHEAEGGRAVVVLGAHGFEALCGARFLRRLGDDCARAGLPTLRIDLPGTGDSADKGDGPGRWKAWVRAGEAAVETMVARGAAEVTLVGFRLGALLAGAVAARQNAVTALAVLAPPLSGRAYAREQVALARLVAARAPEETVGGLSVAGFHLGPDTLADLRRFAWGAESLPALSRALVMAPGSAVAGAGVAQALSRGGAEVSSQTFHGYTAMMCDPTASRLAEDALASVVAWAAGGPTPARRLVTAAPLPHILHGPGWVEERVRFGRDDGLAGVICRPTAFTSDHPAVLILNAGAIPHTGWAGGAVAQARALAAAGRTSLRFDLPGIGDSRPAGPRDEPELYRIARAEIAAALARLCQDGHSRFVLAGACSGAYQAFHAALAEPAVEGLILVNQLCFLWSHHKAVELAFWTRSKAALVTARRHGETNIEINADGETAPGPRSRMRAAGFHAATLQAARRAAKAGLRLASHLGTVLGAILVEPEGVRVTALLQSLSRRGVRVVVVSSEHDPSLMEACRLFGPAGIAGAAVPGLRHLVLPGADHVLTQASARGALAQAVLDATRPASCIGTGEPALSSLLDGAEPI